LPLTRPPAGDLFLRPPLRIEPHRGPADGEQHHQDDREEQRPAPAAGRGIGGRGGRGLRHLWRSCADQARGSYKGFPRCAFSKGPIAAFRSHFLRLPAGP
jgi:hypothetical protein